MLRDSMFVERLLPGSVLRRLSDEEMAFYRAPFPTAESRRPILQFPRQLPIAGEPADVYATTERDQEALRQSLYPKLLFCGDPGALVSPAAAQAFAGHLQNCGVVNLGPGAHYLQEDHPDTIGRSVVEWVIQIA